MHDNYSHKLKLPNGKVIFTQHNAARCRGRDLARWILRRWRPPRYFFHFLHKGGHVAAAKYHLSSNTFCYLDIKNFYGSVSRSKIHRALKKLRFKHHDAQEFARMCTVASPEGLYRYSLPFGFVQSPIIASLALDKSALGNCFRRLQQQGIRISIYVDDIILSDADSDVKLTEALEAIINSAILSNFHINIEKRQGPAEVIELFNLLLSTNNLCVAEHRMNAFRHALILNRHNPYSVTGILAYIRSVNPRQADILETFVDSL